MRIENIVGWLSFIGNIGLLVGVVLVVLQLNQNAELVREQLDHARWSDRYTFHLAMMGENPAKAAEFEETGFGPDFGPYAKRMMDAISGVENLQEYERTMGRIIASQ